MAHGGRSHPGLSRGLWRHWSCVTEQKRSQNSGCVWKLIPPALLPQELRSSQIKLKLFNTAAIYRQSELDIRDIAGEPCVKLNWRSLWTLKLCVSDWFWLFVTPETPLERLRAEMQQLMALVSSLAPNCFALQSPGFWWRLCGFLNMTTNSCSFAFMTQL